MSKCAGPMLYAIMESGLHPLSKLNLLFKFADDTTLVVSADSDVGLDQEFQDVKDWALVNKMILNLIKTKEIVFRRPNFKEHQQQALAWRVDVCTR